MNRIICLGIIAVAGLPCMAQNIDFGLIPDRVFPFESPDEFQRFPGGFVNANAGNVILGAIPSDPNGLSDGNGAEIVTATGAIETFVFPTLEVGENIVVMRVSVQSTGDGAAIGLAALDGSMDGSIGTNVPANSGIYRDRYRRMVLVYDPPGTTVTPVIQVANVPGLHDLSVYLDNLEIYSIPKGVQIPSDFLYGKDTPWTITIPLSLPDGATPLEMVRIDAGTFTMGSPTTEKARNYDETLHQVTISRDFYMGKYEVTNAQFRAFRSGHDSLSFEGYTLNGDNQPVVYVNRDDAVAFCAWLNTQYGSLYPGMTFRLPTESEWEYACRAGTTTRRYWGEDLNEDQACSYANVSDLSTQQPWATWPVLNCSDGFVVTAPVGQFPPNRFGLHDMMGNVWEWCYDYYGAYPPGPVVDPIGKQSGSYRVLRGGGWWGHARNYRSAFRYYWWPSFASYYLGIRVVLASWTP